MRVSHLAVIAAYWNAESHRYAEAHPEFKQPGMHPSWGLWHLPEEQLRLTADAVRPGSTMLDLGCGIGQDAVGFAQQGADVVAIDISLEQLRAAVRHPNVVYAHAAAEQLPLTDASVDVIVSDHGAFDHSPAGALLSESNRVLRQNGIMVICTYSPLAISCFEPESRRISSTLHNDYPTDRMSFDGESVVSERSYSAWVKAFRESGFTVERLEEMLVTPDAESHFDELVDARWSARWPVDIAWVVRKAR